MLWAVLAPDAGQLEGVEPTQQLLADELHEGTRHRDVAEAQVPYAGAKLPLHGRSQLLQNAALILYLRCRPPPYAACSCRERRVEVVKAVEHVDQVLHLEPQAVNDYFAYHDHRGSRLLVKEIYVVADASGMLLVKQILDEEEGAVATKDRSKSLQASLLAVVTAAQHLVLDKKCLQQVSQRRVLSARRRRQVLEGLLDRDPRLPAHVDDLTIREDAMLTFLSDSCDRVSERARNNLFRRLPACSLRLLRRWFFGLGWLEAGRQ